MSPNDRSSTVQTKQSKASRQPIHAADSTMVVPVTTLLTPGNLSEVSSDREDKGDSAKDASDAGKEIASGVLRPQRSNQAGVLENPDTPTLSKVQLVMLASTMSLTMFMMSLSTATSLLTIPTMAVYFGVSELAVQWVVSAYTLAFGCGLLVAGRLADLYSRKYLFVLGQIIGAIANIISGVIPSRIALTVFRALAGLGISISAPASFGIVGTSFRQEPGRTIAFAAMGLGSPFGAGVGDVVGGLMAGAGSKGWQYLYLVIAGFGILPLVGGILFIPRDTPRKNSKDSANDSSPSATQVAPDQVSERVTPDLTGRRANAHRTRHSIRQVDWIGAGLVTLALSLLMFSVTQSGISQRGWRTPYIPPLFVLSILLLIAFGFWERHVEARTCTPPIVKLGIFTRHHWAITSVLLIAFFVWCGISGTVYLASVYWQNEMGLSPIQAAVRLIPAPITGMFCSYVVTLIAPRVSAPLLLILGGIFTGMANCIFAWTRPGRNYWYTEFWAVILAPIGGDLTIPIGSVMISNLCADDEQSVAGALFQVSLMLASTIDICLSSLIQTQLEAKSGLLTGLRSAFWFNAACCWFVIVIVLVSFRKVGLAKDVGRVV